MLHSIPAPPVFPLGSPGAGGGAAASPSQQQQQQQELRSIPVPAINLGALSASADSNYRQWLQQLQERFEKYMQLAATAPAATSSSSSPSSAAAATRQVDEACLQIARREIEVLAVYHCELQKMVTEQHHLIDRNNTELQETSDMAERLQVEVERKSGGGISPRRKAKQQLREQIAAARRQLEEKHASLLDMQQELEGVRAEHLDVRQFISRQFFPVSAVSDQQKLRPPVAQQPPPPASSQHNHHDAVAGAGAAARTTTTPSTSSAPPPLIIRQTKAAELREQLIQERKKGFVPGTSIRSSTYSQWQQQLKQHGGNDNNNSGAGGERSRNNNNTTSTANRSHRDASARVSRIAPPGPLPHQLGQKSFISRKVPRKARHGELSQERNARFRDRPSFRANSLTATHENTGLLPHSDPAVHYSFQDEY